jgi:prepilin-type N-terminal cleavage/methylation domain-containing protein
MNKKGFTIIESLVAITILTLSITGATSIVQGSLNSAQVSKIEGQAIGLAVEGIEYARNVHETTLFNGIAYKPDTPFYNFAEDCVDGCSFEVGAVDQNGSTISASYAVCNSGCELQVSDNGYQTTIIQGAQVSIYQRMIKVSQKPIPGGVEFKVNSKVDYSLGNRSGSIEFDSYLFSPIPPEPDPEPEVE